MNLRTFLTLSLLCISAQRIIALEQNIPQNDAALPAGADTAVTSIANTDTLAQEPTATEMPEPAIAAPEAPVAPMQGQPAALEQEAQPVAATTAPIKTTVAPVAPQPAPKIIAQATSRDADAPATEDETEMCSYLCKTACKGMKDKQIDKLELEIERENNNDLAIKLEEEAAEKETEDESAPELLAADKDVAFFDAQPTPPGVTFIKPQSPDAVAA